MRVLFLHVDYLEYEVKEKAVKGLPELPKEARHGRAEEALVCFISAEKRDEANPIGAAKAAAVNIEDVASQVRTRRGVLYPYSHLSSSLASPDRAQELLAALEKERLARPYHVTPSPFGYYKSFKAAVNVHPVIHVA